MATHALHGNTALRCAALIGARTTPFGAVRIRAAPFPRRPNPHRGLNAARTRTADGAGAGEATGWPRTCRVAGARLRFGMINPALTSPGRRGVDINAESEIGHARRGGAAARLAHPDVAGSAGEPSPQIISAESKSMGDSSGALILAGSERPVECYVARRNNNHCRIELSLRKVGQSLKMRHAGSGAGAARAGVWRARQWGCKAGRGPAAEGGACLRFARAA